MCDLFPSPIPSTIFVNITTLTQVDSIGRTASLPPDCGADWNGGNRFLSGAPDSRWNDDEMNTRKRLTGSDCELVQMGPLTTQ
jgi:hypothetical protein